MMSDVGDGEERGCKDLKGGVGREKREKISSINEMFEGYKTY